MQNKSPPTKQNLQNIPSIQNNPSSGPVATELFTIFAPVGYKDVCMGI